MVGEKAAGANSILELWVGDPHSAGQKLVLSGDVFLLLCRSGKKGSLCCSIFRERGIASVKRGDVFNMRR